MSNLNDIIKKNIYVDEAIGELDVFACTDCNKIIIAPMSDNECYNCGTSRPDNCPNCCAILFAECSTCLGLFCMRDTNEDCGNTVFIYDGDDGEYTCEQCHEEEEKSCCTFCDCDLPAGELICVECKKVHDALPDKATLRAEFNKLWRD